jgi:hypothetical protein
MGRWMLYLVFLERLGKGYGGVAQAFGRVKMKERNDGDASTAKRTNEMAIVSSSYGHSSRAKISC